MKALPLKRKGTIRPPSKTIQWTSEQVDIHRDMERGSDHMMIHALAGTGKTSTVIGGFVRDKTSRTKGLRRAIAVFGKANGKELQAKVPPDVKAGTLHSLMFGVIRQAMKLPSGNRAVCEDRDHILLDQILGRRRLPRGGRWNVSKLASLAKNTGITPEEVGNPTGFLRDLIIRHGVSSKIPEAELIDLTNQLIKLSCDEQSVQDTGINFDDMLFLPYYLNIKPPFKYDQLVIDEAQDTNVVQQYNALSVGERITLVGDENQSIYGFRGADTEALNSLEEKLGNVRHYPLTVCWRCPREVILLAQRLVPAIQSRPDAPDGEVLEVSPDSIIDEVSPGRSMVLCRTNAPLVHLVFQLWAKSIRAYIQGRRFGQDLLEYVTAEEHYGMTLDELVARLRDRMQREESRLLQIPNSDGQIVLLHDKIDCILALAQNATTTDRQAAVTELKDRLNYLFTDAEQSDKVRLSSIHRAKGLEADDVYIIEPHLLPHPMAQQPWEQVQEANLCYVAVTRARQRLIFAGSIPRMLRDGWRESES